MFTYLSIITLNVRINRTPIRYTHLVFTYITYIEEFIILKRPKEAEALLKRVAEF